MKAGKQIAKMKATELYKEQLKRLCPTLDGEAVQREAEEFEHLLAQMLNN